MSKLAKGGIVKMPAPVMGVDWSVAPSEVQYPYSPLSLDWIANGYEVKIRDLHKELSNSTGFLGLASFDAEGTIIAYTSTNVYEYDTVAETRNSIHAGLLPFYSHVNYQSKIFLATSAGAASWDGTTFNTTAFVGTAASGPNVGSCIYRDRYVRVTGTTLDYAASAGALSGTLNTFNLASYYTAGTFVDCASITITDSNSLSDYLILISTAGDILAFTGDFPGAANWNLVVRTKITTQTFASLSPYMVGIAPYHGDAYIYIGYPATFISAKALIQQGRLAAEEASPLARQLNVLRSQYLPAIYSVCSYPSTNSMIVIITGTSISSFFEDRVFGYSLSAQSSIMLYIDIKSGSVSPLTYPQGSIPLSTSPFSNKTIPHSDGFVYSVSTGTSTMWRLMNNTSSEVSESDNTFLQFPYTNLNVPDSIKNFKMAYPIMSRQNGYVDASLSILPDGDRDIVSSYSSETGSASAGNYIAKRLIVPIGGSGSEVSIALTNTRRPRLACQQLSVQFEDGGPY